MYITTIAKPAHQSIIKSTVFRSGKGAFTLIELMIALVIFSVVAVLSVTGMRSLIDAKHQQIAHSADLKQLQLAQALLSRDIQQIINRPIRNASNSIASGFVGYSLLDVGGQLDSGEHTLFEFTRMGYPNPRSTVARSTLERIRYSVNHQELIRTVWAGVDNLANAQATELVLLKNLEGIQLSYVDSAGNEAANWLTEFAGLTIDNSLNFTPQRNLPSALDIKLSLKQFGALEWYFLLAGGRRYAQ